MLRSYELLLHFCLLNAVDDSELITKSVLEVFVLKVLFDKRKYIILYKDMKNIVIALDFL